MRHRILLALLAGAIAMGVGLSSARANTLDLGGSYTSPIYMIVNSNAVTEGGGSIDPSSLDGKSLLWVYCVDINDVVYVPGMYDNTTVTSTGVVNGSPVTNAAQVAWLLAKYAQGGQGDWQAALQAAIWHEIYGSSVYLDTSQADSTQQNDYNTMLAALGANTGNVADFSWLSPGISGSSTTYQGLVGSVPDGGMTLVLLGGALLGLETLRRRLRA